MTSIIELAKQEAEMAKMQVEKQRLRMVHAKQDIAVDQLRAKVREAIQVSIDPKHIWVNGIVPIAMGKVQDDDLWIASGERYASDDALQNELRLARVIGGWLYTHAGRMGTFAFTDLASLGRRIIEAESENQSLSGVGDLLSDGHRRWTRWSPQDS